MAAQDEVVFAWMDRGGSAADSLEIAVERTIALRKKLIVVTRAQPGGMWILRAIRALPLLREVRAASRDKVLHRQFALMREIHPNVGLDQLWAAVRLSEETVYAMIEMIIEDPSLDEDRVIAETSWMTTLYFSQIERR
jgi:hypothetical protein